MDPVRLKVVIVGDGAVGKSALLWVYMHQEFKDEYIPTVVDNYAVTLQLKDRKLNLEVFDTAGQEDFKEIRKTSFSGTDVVIVCYNCSNKDTLANVKSQWIPEVHESDDKAPFVLVGTKSDLYQKGELDHVTEADAKRMGRQLGAYTALRCSAKEYAESNNERGNIEDVFNAAIKIGLIRKGIIQEESLCSCNLL